MTEAPTAPKRVTRFLKRRREPGEIATPVASIRNHCLECCGYQPSEVELCTAPKCWLWPWRFGRTPEGAARQGKESGVEAQTRRILPKNTGQAPGFACAGQAAAGHAPGILGDRSGAQSPAVGADLGGDGHSLGEVP